MEAPAFYLGPLEFKLTGGGEDAANTSVARGDARLMLETAADFYGDEYNAGHQTAPGVAVADVSLTSKPLTSKTSTPDFKLLERRSSTLSPSGHGVRWSSPSRITRATGWRSGRTGSGE